MPKGPPRASGWDQQTPRLERPLAKRRAQPSRSTRSMAGVDSPRPLPTDPQHVRFAKEFIEAYVPHLKKIGDRLALNDKAETKDYYGTALYIQGEMRVLQGKFPLRQNAYLVSVCHKVYVPYDDGTGDGYFKGWEESYAFTADKMRENVKITSDSYGTAFATKLPPSLSLRDLLEKRNASSYLEKKALCRWLDDNVQHSIIGDPKRPSYICHEKYRVDNTFIFDVEF